MDLPRPGVKPMSPSLAGRLFFTTEPPGKSPLPAFYNTNSPKFHPFLKWADSAGKTKKPETQGTEAGMQNHRVVPKPQAPTDSHPPGKRRGTQAILRLHLDSDPHFCFVNVNHHFRDLSCQLGPLAIFTYCITCKEYTRLQVAAGLKTKNSNAAEDISEMMTNFCAPRSSSTTIPPRLVSKQPVSSILSASRGGYDREERGKYKL